MWKSTGNKARAMQMFNVKAVVWSGGRGDEFCSLFFFFLIFYRVMEDLKMLCI